MSSNDIAVSVRGLSKSYTIAHNVEKHSTMGEALLHRVKNPLQKVEKETFWALKDVEFDIKQGDVVGIVGRNGAGKSTLLKVLSQITEPTTGEINLYGRVGSLLEVGTGFHPELTGRENIYLNGAILGMRRKEIERQFDAIVEFAEVEQFLDTPVKRYSSGMYVRLAFAVAAHLNPEILIVDEVLAVGDAQFQRKCLGKMQDVAGQGRTVLFVSHNMAVIQALCTSGILLKNGTVFSQAPIQNTVTSYLNMMEQSVAMDLLQRTDRRGKGHIRLCSIEVASGDVISSTLVTGRPARFVFHLTSLVPGLACNFTLYDQHGLPVTQFNSAVASEEDRLDMMPASSFVCEIDSLPLVPGRYRLNASIYNGTELEDHIEAASFFDVEAGHIAGRPVSANTGYGNIYVRHRWIVA